MSNPYQNLWGNPQIGHNVKLGAYVEIGKDVQLGNNCMVEAFVFIAPLTVIEDDVFLGPRVTILNDKYPPSPREQWMPVHIEQGASIGGGAVILPGVTIGKNARIGAGSVVTRDVPAEETWCGNPARPM